MTVFDPELWSAFFYAWNWMTLAAANEEAVFFVVMDVGEMINNAHDELARPAPDTDLPQENGDLVAARVQAPMPFPRFSLMLVAYMAWPEHQAFRDEWMSTNLARFLENSGARLSASEWRL
jgi:hypothetical protein